MKTSEKGINLIKEFESFESKAYVCPAGVLTIGYGHTKGVKAGQTVTEQEAERLLKEDLQEAENAVNKSCKSCKSINQNQFDALVSFVFNVGAWNFKNSTLLKLIKNRADNPFIRSEFEKWKYANKKEMAGLLRRRKSEAELYFSK